MEEVKRLSPKIKLTLNEEVKPGKPDSEAAVNTEDQSSIEGDAAVAVAEEVKKNNHVVRKLEKRQQICTLDQHIEEQFGGGRLLACISSRPGQWLC
ncbi:golgin candidate 5 [Prunus dulcis]|uniref:Golgin candidate 5 n=1 Tax=Prunus dulcis TaxID=3755 RepID=A0A5H2XK99_PRUDU|nr:golgin candidate 5 [Prunus dulcis]